jgi:hypothetical protein
MKHLRMFEDFGNLFEELTAKQKKLPKGLRDAIEKKEGKKPKKGDDKDEEEDDKKAKGKKGKKYDKEEEKVDNKGLTAKQKKLPAGLQKAILKKKNK